VLRKVSYLSTLFAHNILGFYIEFSGKVVSVSNFDDIWYWGISIVA
jgi:hypothetical protein